MRYHGGMQLVEAAQGEPEMVNSLLGASLIGLAVLASASSRGQSKNGIDICSANLDYEVLYGVA